MGMSNVLISVNSHLQGVDEFALRDFSHEIKTGGPIPDIQNYNRCQTQR